jgi:hypothetical protein
MYASELPIRDARQIYFDVNGFRNGGYDDKWVKLKAGPLAFYFPNSAARVRSVKLHDLHHVATEYTTTWVGEAEIAAWEIASWCGRHWVAWLLNLGAFAIGLVIAPRKTFRAFVRGRHTSNLYSVVFEDHLLDGTVGELRTKLGLGEALPAPSASEYASFVFWAIVAVVVSVAPYVIGLAGIAWLLFR